MNVDKENKLVDDTKSKNKSRPASPINVADQLNEPGNLYVINRHGEKEAISFDKILVRIRKLASVPYKLSTIVDPDNVAKNVITQVRKGITTNELDKLAAEICAYAAADHPDYSVLAARIAIDNLHKSTDHDYMDVIDKLHFYVDAEGVSCKLIHDDLYAFIKANITAIQEAFGNYEIDKKFDYFGFKTLEKSYLLKVRGVIVERPSHLFMRVSCSIHLNNMERALETFHLMSNKYFIHATPTLFNAGTLKPQMSSCFLLTMKEDSIDGIFETLKQCALISKTAGGIGLSVHNVRASESYIRGTNGRSNGLVPMLRVFNDTARYVDQGGGKRKGSFAIYLEPWHADIIDFLNLRKNHGKEEQRARDLFYALWIPDLFMKRVEAEDNWTLMCPNKCLGLAEVYGKDFEALYEKYEKADMGHKTIKARDLWIAICESQIETGTPYMLYKDACNRKSNQKNLGTIKSSNLCTEIIQYTSPEEVAVCNLASIALPQYVDADTRTFNFGKLQEVTRLLTRNLNNVIDINYYPVKEAENSNFKHRPIGLGIQGLADVFMLLGEPFASDASKKLNRQIFETIYYAAVDMSCRLAEESGAYQTFKGSPASFGKFQFDLWNDEYEEKGVDKRIELDKDLNLDWEALRKRMVTHGLRNSLLLAPMPTASTSQILGNNEAFEPYTSNIYYRRVLSGEFFVVNKHLLKDLIKLDLWNKTMKQFLIAANGSIQNIEGIPKHIKEMYKTVWEIRQKEIITMAVDRAPFIDQSMSLNIHMVAPNFSKLTSMHFMGWRAGLKTGVYYLRTQPAAEPVKFSVDVNMTQQPAVCAMRPKDAEEDEACMACSG